MRRAAMPRLFVRRAGVRGPLIVLLHGLASSSHYWTPGVPYLAGDHRLLLPDLLGFGRSPKPSAASYVTEQHVAALARTLAELNSAGERLVLGGHSAGSLIALRYAADFPEQVAGLLLLSLPVIGCLPWGHRDDGSMPALHRFVAHTTLGARLATSAIRAAGPLGRLLAPRVQRDVPPDAARDALAVTAASYWRTLENVVYGADVPATLDRLRSPLQLLHGDRDQTAPFAAVQALVAARPELPLHVVAGAGHNPWFTHTEETTGVLRGFARRVAQS